MNPYELLRQIIHNTPWRNEGAMKDALAITGNHFDAGTTAGTCVDFGAGRAGTADVMLWGNEYTTTGTKIAHTPAGTVLTNATGEFML